MRLNFSSIKRSIKDKAKSKMRIRRVIQARSTTILGCGLEIKKKRRTIAGIIEIKARKI